MFYFTTQGKSYNKIVIKYFENVAKFQHLGITEMNRNYIKSESLVFSSPAKRLKSETYEAIILLFYMFVNVISHPNGSTKFGSVSKQAELK